MGLDTTHGAFNGPYSKFNRFRMNIAKAWGGSYPPHDDKTLEDKYVYLPNKANKNNGLTIFLESNDCEGKFSPKECKKIANEMENLLPILKEQNKESYNLAFIFIKGCKLAFKENEYLVYD